MNLKVDYIPDGCVCDTKQTFSDGQPQVITIHYIGPHPGQSPAAVRKWWIDSKAEPSAHFVVKDDDVLQCWPTNKVAWHAGCRAGNLTSIGIEVVPCNTQGRFSEKSIKTLKELLDTLPRLPLVRHYDWTGKNCPAYYVNNDEWKELLVKLGRGEK